jgi:hypothetical protein
LEPAIRNRALERPSYKTPWFMWSYTGRNPYIPVYGVLVGGVTVATPTGPFLAGSFERPHGIHTQVGKR